MYGQGGVIPGHPSSRASFQPVASVPGTGQDSSRKLSKLKKKAAPSQPALLRVLFLTRCSQDRRGAPSPCCFHPPGVTTPGSSVHPEGQRHLHPLCISSLCLQLQDSRCLPRKTSCPCSLGNMEFLRQVVDGLLPFLP